MPKNLRELPKFRDGLSYLYVEHCSIEQNGKAIAIFDQYGKVPVPCANLGLLMLGPGTKITHSAISSLAKNGCLIQWLGEQAVRFYASGQGETRSAKGIIQQAKLVSNPALRKEVVRRMYMIRFKEPIAQDLSIKQMRGMEGARMKQIYAVNSQEYNVTWEGRHYDQKQWKDSDPINRALSVANACLYGICHSAIVTAGYSPALGFIHTGQQLSFVFDIGDLYKADLIIPLAFRLVSESVESIEQRIRIACRDLFYTSKLLSRIIPEIQTLMDIPVQEDDENYTAAYLSDMNLDQGSTVPGTLWDPDEGLIQGGRQFDDSE